MKIPFKYALITAVWIALAGCTMVQKEIKTESQSVRTDVFTEISDQKTPQAGFVVLEIKASIKTAKAGTYLYESKESPHGKPGYPFLINIDGQAIIWKIDGEEETTPRYDKDLNRDPEGGEGVKYILDKKIILAAGRHRVFFGLPGENYIKEVHLTLNEGETYVLEFKPVYGYSLPREHFRNFLRGITNYEVFLNGKYVSTKTSNKPRF